MSIQDIKKFYQISTQNKVALPGTTFSSLQVYGTFFIAQGRVTLKRIFQPNPNSILSEIKCLFWILTILKKLRSKLKALCPGQGEI